MLNLHDINQVSSLRPKYSLLIFTTVIIYVRNTGMVYLGTLFLFHKICNLDPCYQAAYAPCTSYHRTSQGGWYSFYYVTVYRCHMWWNSRSNYSISPTDHVLLEKENYRIRRNNGSHLCTASYHTWSKSQARYSIDSTDHVLLGKGNYRIR